VGDDALDIDELVSRLQKLGIDDFPKNTIKRWAFTEKLITQPVTPKLKGRSFKSDWKKDVVEEAAAVWAVRNCGVMKPKALTKKKIDIIKSVAAKLDDEPFAIYTLPPVSGPLSTKRVAAKDIEIKFVSEKCEGLNLFPGEKKEDKVNNLNNLVVIWITAVEKVREWMSRGIKAQAAESEWGKLIPAEINFSQIDPWLVEVPCPWRIGKPACVKLSYFSRSSKNNGREFSRPPFPFQRGLSKSNHNEIILLDNWVDTREFFTIDVSAGEDYAKVRNAEIERKIRRSKSPLEKMMLKTNQAHIKTWFGV
jgi:hypothetical protein